MASYVTKSIFARNLSDLLTRSNITQLELANKMGVAASTVSSWCNGEKMPRMDKIEWMANFFNVSRSDLIEAHYQSTSFNIIKIAGRDGSYREKRLTDEDLAALTILIDRFPDASDSL